MALGGGKFNLQNKELPGAYINYVSEKGTPSAKLQGASVPTRSLANVVLSSFVTFSFRNVMKVGVSDEFTVGDDVGLTDAINLSFI